MFGFRFLIQLLFIFPLLPFSAYTERDTRRQHLKAHPSNTRVQVSPLSKSRSAFSSSAHVRLARPSPRPVPENQFAGRMAEVKNVRKRKAELLSEQQCMPTTVLTASGGGFLSDPLVFSHHHLNHHGYVPPTKLFLQMHHHNHSATSTSCSSGSLLDESSRGEFSTGDACSELDFASDANSSTAAGRRKQRHETSLGQLTKKFVALLNQAEDGVSFLPFFRSFHFRS